MAMGGQPTWTGPTSIGAGSTVTPDVGLPIAPPIDPDPDRVMWLAMHRTLVRWARRIRPRPGYPSPERELYKDLRSIIEAIEARYGFTKQETR
jgi:hypothetical protein